MMCLRAIIIDDEELGAETLKFLIEKYVADVKVVAQTTRPKEAIVLIEDYKPEIVFLDITMPEMDGFELLEKLKWREFDLIFTTAHQEHGIKAIKQNASDYLLKPIDHEDLVVAIEKIKRRREQSQLYQGISLNNPAFDFNKQLVHKLAVSSKHSVESVDPAEIISLESKSNYTKVYLRDGRDILSPRTLGEFDLQLCHANSNFMRVHHSFVVNLQNVLRYMKESDTLIMINHQKIPLARSRKNAFIKWLNTLF